MYTTSDSSVGKVLTTLTLTNRADQSAVVGGFIPSDQICSVTLHDVLVDIGATTLCLPANIIAHRGLELLKEVDVVIATRLSTARVFQDAKISLCGREVTFECLELPGARNALIGVIPVEVLDLEPDLQNQMLKVLPSESIDTYLDDSLERLAMP